MSLKHEEKAHRKRRRTFLQQQTRFCKQGRYGKGSNLDEDTYQYFLRILEVMRKSSSEEDAADREMLANNVFEETQGNEVEYSCNQLASRVIEELLPYSSNEAFQQYLKAFMKNPRPVINDPFCSHVFEQLISTSAERYFKIPEDQKIDEGADWRTVYKNGLLSISKFLLNNLEEYVWDKYANHVIQVCLRSVSGSIKLQNSKDSDTCFKVICPKVEDKDLNEVLDQFTGRLSSWPQFCDLPNTDLTSSLLQSLLLANERNRKTLKKIIKRLVHESFKTVNNNSELLLLDNAPAVRLLETCICVSSTKTSKLILDECFIGRLKQFAFSRTSNFALQKLLKYVKSKEDLDVMFVELCEHFEDILAVGHSGVILALAQACSNMQTKQGDFIKMLSKALHCWEPAERNLSIVPLVSTLTIYENSSAENKINLHGSLIVQEMLKFKKPITLVNSILNIDTPNLVKIICDPRGSHIVDALMNGPFIGEKSREKFTKKLQGHYSELAKSKHGSRSFDAVWKLASLKLKLMIMEELKVKQSEVESNQFGKGVTFSVKLDYYRRSKDVWIKAQTATNTKQKLFADIIGN